jgi:alcohol dehydrogenase (NADP+)
MHLTTTLSNDLHIPNLGLGTWKSDKSQVAAAVELAITEVGIRHIDCASIYGNEVEIGQAFSSSLTTKKITRDELFVTSKLWNTDHEPAQVELACRKTLKDLQLEYLDLYLIHWGVAFAHGEGLEPLDENGKVKTMPVSTQQTWEAMEALVKKGLVKSIGVANFTTTMLVDLLSYAQIKPVTNQIELHPYNAQAALVEFCHDHQIAVTAYSPLGSPGALKSGEPQLLADKVITEIAAAHHKTPAQILLRWAIQRGTIPIPKSTRGERIKENALIFDFTLSEEEMERINGLDRKQRFVHPMGWWGLPYFE